MRGTKWVVEFEADRIIGDGFIEGSIEQCIGAKVTKIKCKDPLDE